MTSTNPELIPHIEDMLNTFSSNMLSLALEYGKPHSIESFLKVLLEEYESYLVKTKDNCIY